MNFANNEIEDNQPIDGLIYDLRERAKELNALYQVQEILNQPDASLEDVCRGIVEVIPPGWQYPDVCHAQITIRDSSYKTPDFIETSWVQRSPIILQDETIGEICVYYTEDRPIEDEGPFLKEERKLIDTIAEQLRRPALPYSALC